MTASRSKPSSTQPSDEVIISLREARSGEPYAVADSFRFHSSYDPATEAERFVLARLKGRDPSIVLLLGDTLPYVRRALRRASTAGRMVLVFYHPFFYRAWRSEVRDAAATGEEIAFPAFGGGEEAFRAFLDELLPEQEAEGLLVLEWPQSAAAFPDLSRRLNEALAAKMRELSASLATSVGFGRLWIRNSLANYLSIEATLLPRSTSLPVVIAASGPSLRRAIPLLQAHRRGYQLLALPSSLHALLDAGLTPDLVVATDPGFWARLHLAPLAAHPEIPLAMPLTAAPPPRRAAPIALLSEGSFVERELLSELSTEPPVILPGGTVASTAFHLARRISSGPVVFAGLDLAFEDIREHVSPHAFELFFAHRVCRLRPEYSAAACGAFDRFEGSAAQAEAGTGRFRTTRAFSEYGEWLSRLTDGQLSHRLLPAGRPLPGMAGLSPHGFAHLIETLAPEGGRPGMSTAAALPPFGERRARVERLLGEWEATIEGLARSWREGGSTPQLLSDARHSALFSALDLQGLLRLRRVLREGPPARARDALLDTTSSISVFLAGLAERYLR